jgi:hypothetical protein
MGTSREKTVIGWKARKEGAECAIRRERERKERRERLNEDGREIGWTKEIWKRRRDRMEKERSWV